MNNFNLLIITTSIFFSSFSYSKGLTFQQGEKISCAVINCKQVVPEFSTPVSKNTCASYNNKSNEYLYEFEVGNMKGSLVETSPLGKVTFNAIIDAGTDVKTADVSVMNESWKNEIFELSVLKNGKGYILLPVANLQMDELLVELSCTSL